MIEKTDPFSIFSKDKPQDNNSSNSFENMPFKEWKDYTPKQGERNNFLSRYAFKLALENKDYDYIKDELSPIAIETQYDIKELDAVIISAISKKNNQKINDVDNETDTDLDNAKRLLKLSNNTIISINKNFHIYEDGYWKRDTSNTPNKYASKVNQVIKNELLEKDNTDYLIPHFKKSKMINHQNNMVTQLHSLVPVSHEDVDTEETYQLINFTNGILDVTNGQLNPHDPKYLITMQVPYEYNPNAQCPEWHKFLDRITRTSKIKQDLQTLAGQIIISETFENFIVFRGNGANGKTIFTQILQAMMGDYSAQVETEVVSGNANKSQSKFAQHFLKDKRLIITSETDKGCELSGSFVKQITSHSLFTSEEKHKPKTQWYPTCHMILETNHDPVIKEQTDAINRRVKIFPFEDRIPDEEQIDPDELLNKLKAELPGIFNWAYIGYKLNKKLGGFKKALTNHITDATKLFMEEQNPIHNFLTECTIKNRSADPIKLTTLYKKYKLYVLEEEEYEISRNAFSKILQEMNYKKGRNNQGVIFYGLELNHESKYIKPRDIMYE